MADRCDPRVGFIGLGAMGRPMCARLAQAGTDLFVHDINDSAKSAAAKETGARPCRDAHEMAKSCDIIITMLPDSGIVRRALGAADPLGAGTIVVDMSSSDPLDTRALGKELGRNGVTLLDAPVSGGVRKAVTGELCIMLGGNDAAALDRAESVLASMGRVERTGSLGSGHSVKALNNFVSAAGLAAVCEALIVAQRLGVDPERLIDVINLSTGRNVTTEVKAKAYMISGEFHNAQFAMDLMAKDVAIAASLADALDLALPNLREAAQLWSHASAALGPEADHTEMLSYLKLGLRGG